MRMNFDLKITGIPTALVDEILGLLTKNGIGIDHVDVKAGILQARKSHRPPSQAAVAKAFTRPPLKGNGKWPHPEQSASGKLMLELVGKGTTSRDALMATFKKHGYATGTAPVVASKLVRAGFLIITKPGHYALAKPAA